MEETLAERVIQFNLLVLGSHRIEWRLSMSSSQTELDLSPK